MREESEREYTQDGYCPIKAGEILGGRYRAVRKLGWGVYSTVWLAVDQVTPVDHDRPRQCVAIKVSKANERYAKAVHNELRLLQASLGQGHRSEQFGFSWDRPAVPRVLDSFTHVSRHTVNNHHALVFEPLGQNLVSLMQRQYPTGFPLHWVRSFARDLIAAIAALHDLKIMHTDVKLANLLIVEDNVDELVAAEMASAELSTGSTRSRSRSSSTSSDRPCTPDHLEMSTRRVAVKVRPSEPIGTVPISTLVKNLSTQSLTRVKRRTDLASLVAPTMSASSSGSSAAGTTGWASPTYCTSTDSPPTPFTSPVLGSDRRRASEASDPSDSADRIVSVANRSAHEPAPRIVLADLSNAWRFDQRPSGCRIQTQAYRAPELLIADEHAIDEDYDESIDIWSIGCVLYEMATGEQMFDFDSVHLDSADLELCRDRSVRPQDLREHRRRTEHVAQILEILGPTTWDTVGRIHHYNEHFFHEHDPPHPLLPRDQKLRPWPLASVLAQKHDIHDPAFADFLKRGLQFDARHRTTAAAWLDDVWLAPEVPTAAEQPSPVCTCQASQSTSSSSTASPQSYEDAAASLEPVSKLDNLVDSFSEMEIRGRPLQRRQWGVPIWQRSAF